MEPAVKRQLIIAGLAFATIWSAQADTVPLGEEALKQTLTGKTVHLDTPFGVAIPITYQAKGLMSGKAGVLAFYLGAIADRGRWWVSEGKLCQKWFKWLDAQPSCMQLNRDGNKIVWRRDDGLSGTATIVATLPSGAEGAPHGLGGPVNVPELRRPVTADWTVETVRSEALAPKLPVSSPPTTVSRAHRRPSDGSGDQPTSIAMANSAIGAEQDYMWCRSGFGTAGQISEARAEPNLLLVARLQLAPSEVPSPNACLTVDTALRHVAIVAPRER